MTWKGSEGFENCAQEALGPTWLLSSEEGRRQIVYEIAAEANLKFEDRRVKGMVMRQIIYVVPKTHYQMEILLKDINNMPEYRAARDEKRKSKNI